ncbi:MAG TPA: alpha/beta hydrolase [Candidatus Binatus sp.]|nr:alpha/beta hydrolase [Candidatus Binatus sp.]
MGAHRFGPEHPAETYVPHAFPEQTIDTGDAVINYAVAGTSDKPALLLIPGQTESWWGYEQAMDLLKEHFQAFAVDLRGQGRSSRTPGRYTLDNFGNDLVRFIALAIRRPVLVSGLSSGGVIAAWLSAYAMPGTVRGAHYEDPPLFSSAVNPSCGHSIRQAIGPIFGLMSKYLGDQWSIGDWSGMIEAAKTELPDWLRPVTAPMLGAGEIPQRMKEYDPEWARAFWEGTVYAGSDHARMLARVKCPVLYTHHFRHVDEARGYLLGAASDEQAKRVCELVKSTGQTIDYRSFPRMPHSMHGTDPKQFVELLVEFNAKLRG